MATSSEGKRGNYEDRHYSDDSPLMQKTYITNPVHGGKVTCEKCGGFILEGDHAWVYDEWEVKRYFHLEPCYNRYEHYYGFNKPID